jgi:hypothetical protein
MYLGVEAVDEWSHNRPVIRLWTVAAGIEDYHHTIWAGTWPITREWFIRRHDGTRLELTGSGLQIVIGRVS